jgi:hypothetical protein
VNKGVAFTCSVKRSGMPGIAAPVGRLRGVTGSCPRAYLVEFQRGPATDLNAVAAPAQSDRASWWRRVPENQCDHALSVRSSFNAHGIRQ